MLLTRNDNTNANRAEQRNQEPSTVWSTPARIIGFEGKTVWMLCEGVSVTTAMDKLRPRTAAEILAYQVLSREFEMRPADQQGLMHPAGVTTLMMMQSPSTATTTLALIPTAAAS